MSAPQQTDLLARLGAMEDELRNLRLKEAEVTAGGVVGDKSLMGRSLMEDLYGRGVISSGSVLSPNVLFGWRFIAPTKGLISIVAIAGEAFSGGNKRVGIYDVGQATGGESTLLQGSSLTALPPRTSAPTSKLAYFSSPLVNVEQGQHFDVGLVWNGDYSGSALTWTEAGGHGHGYPPAGLIPTALSQKLSWQMSHTATNPLPTSIPEASKIRNLILPFSIIVLQ